MEVHCHKAAHPVSVHKAKKCQNIPKFKKVEIIQGEGVERDQENYGIFTFFDFFIGTVTKEKYL